MMSGSLQGSELEDLGVGTAFGDITCMDGECTMFSEDEEGFEFTHESQGNAAEDYFDVVVSAIEDIMMEDGFESAISSFCRSGCHVFDDGPENKLEYMPMFHEYVALVERTLEEKLLERVPDFCMTRFIEQMQQRSEHDLQGDVFDMLLTATDFDSFKAHMLSYKTEGDVADLLPHVRAAQVHLNEQEAGDARPDLDLSLCVSSVGTA